MFIEAVPVRFVTVPLAGVPRIAPLPSVATPVTPSVLLNVPVVAATDDGVVAPSVPFILVPDRDVKVPAAGVTLPIALALANKEVTNILLVALTFPSIGKKSSPANVVAVALTALILVVAIYIIY
jgi:hypothetical protein